MKFRIIIFKGIRDVLDIMAEHLGAGFEAIGYEVLYIDVTRLEEGILKIPDFVKKEFLSVISFNNLGMNMELENGCNYWEQLGVPFINIIVDHPFHYHDALVNAPKGAIVLCIDENHSDYIRRFYPNIFLTDFLAHGGTKTCFPLQDYENREIDVLYVGVLSAKKVVPRILNENKYKHIPVQKIWDSALEMTRRDSKLLTEDAIEKALSIVGIYLPDEELRELISDFRIIDYYTVSYYREKVVETLVKAGIRVTIYGEGWNQCEWINSPNCNYFGKVPVETVLEKMKTAKIVLNTMTWFKKGSHERVINGMLAKSVVVTDESEYINNNFEDGVELYTFSLDEIDLLPKKIRCILDNESQSKKVAEQGYNRAINSECWEHRAKEIDYCLFESLKGEVDRSDEVDNSIIPDSYEFLAGRGMQDQKRMESQSGGVFRGIAEGFFQKYQNAKVYGVTLDGDEAKYIGIDNSDGIYRLLRSKYVSPQINNLYSEIVKDLLGNRKVLLSASPCVADAALKYIEAHNVSRDNLWVIDLICHGTPNAQIFKDYMQFLKDRWGKVTDFRFRDKAKLGWHAHLESYLTLDNERVYDDIYSNIFMNNLGYKESCYICKYATTIRNSDMTIGDCWGPNDKIPMWNDETGISLAILRNEKAKELVSMALDTEWKPIDYNDYMQPNLQMPTKRPDKEDEFLKDIRSLPTEIWLSKYGQEHINSTFENCVLWRTIENINNNEFPSDMLNKLGIKKVALMGKKMTNSVLLNDFKCNGITVLAIIDLWEEYQNQESDEIPLVKQEHFQMIDWKIVDRIILTDEANMAEYLDIVKGMNISIERIIPLSFIANCDI